VPAFASVSSWVTLTEEWKARRGQGEKEEIVPVRDFVRNTTGALGDEMNIHVCNVLHREKEAPKLQVLFKFETRSVPTPEL